MLFEMETDALSTGDTDRQVEEFEERMARLKSITNRELGYNLGTIDAKPQILDCDCGEVFEVNVKNGLICPHCGRGSDDRGE